MKVPDFGLALGIILYELATGRRPFTGGSSFDISSAILRDKGLQPTKNPA